MEIGYHNYPQGMNQSQSHLWPYIQAKNYSDWPSILEAFPHLKQTNTPLDLSSQQNACGIVIRSANDDNVHKAIKYGIWTTTPKNKSKIQKLWERKVHNNFNTYLFFSVVKSGMFQGVARLKSGYHEQTFPFWWQNHTLKFKGYFELEWVYIKDVNYKHFNNLYNVEGEEAVKSKDCDIVDNQTTSKMLTIFDGKQGKRSIFNDFAYMDERESQYIRKMYEVSSYYNQNPSYNQNQSYNANFDFNQYSMVNNPINVIGGMSSINPITPIGIPSLLLRPTVTEMQPRNNLGFQMNPISKNRKK